MYLDIVLRSVLLAASLLILIYMLNRIRRARLRIADAVFWIMFALSLVLLSVFPQIAYWGANLLRIESPANLVLVYINGILLIRSFTYTVNISRSGTRTDVLAQKLAIYQKMAEDEKHRGDELESRLRALEEKLLEEERGKP